MICAFLYHGGDTDRLLDLLTWIEQLGGCQAHDALLVADYETPYKSCVLARSLARKSFKEVRTISNGKGTSGWIAGANSLFWAAARYVQGGWPQPFLVMETDAVPLKGGWLTSLEAEYLGLLKPFMGDVYVGLANGMPTRAVSGIAIYPADAASRLKPSDTESWDMANREYLLENAHATHQIKHLYGELKLPPTFVRFKAENAPVNAFTPDQIRSEAVLFHRNKDGTLIRLLRERDGIKKAYHPLIVVFSAHNGDAPLMIENFQWLHELDGPSDFDAVLACDATLQSHLLQRLRELGQRAFPKLQSFTYPKPRQRGWPQAPNHAFQSTARWMAQFNRPWLWMEPDAWGVRPGWLDTLEGEYLSASKPVMGPVVPGMGHHVNGCAIYPANFCQISPRAMKATNQAWDAFCRPDLDGKIHDASRLMQHIWGNGPNGFTPWGGEGSPTFPTAERLNWILPSAVMVHRVKDTTLIRWLRLKR